MELVSVIVPIYNVEKYLAKCLESIINQTYKNIEILAIIDGSPDNSIDIVEKYAKEDSRIKIVNRKINKGLLASRCEGVLLSKGKYIMFCDSDDWIDNTMIEEMLCVLENTKSDFVKCSFVREYNDHFIKSSIIDETKTYNKEEFNEYIYPKFVLGATLNNIWGELIKRELIDVTQIEQTIAMGEDAILNCHLYEKAKKVTLMNDSYYHYRYNLNSMTNSNSSIIKIQKDFNDVVNVQKAKIKLIDNLNDRNLNLLASLSIIKMILGQSVRVGLLEGIRYKEAKKYIQERFSNDIVEKINSEYISEYSFKDKLVYACIKNNMTFVVYAFSKFILMKNKRR